MSSFARKTFAISAAAALLPVVAQAHPGDHHGMTAAEGIRHLLSQPDHLLELAGFAVLITLAAGGGWRKLWRRSAP